MHVLTYRIHIAFAICFFFRLRLFNFGFLLCSFKRKKVINIASKHQKELGSRSKLLIPLNFAVFEKQYNTDFVEKVTKAFCILILLSTSKTISASKTYFTSLANSLVSETACRKTMLQLSADELQRIKKCCLVSMANKFICIVVNLYYVCHITTLLKQLTMLFDLMGSPETFSV